MVEDDNCQKIGVLMDTSWGMLVNMTPDEWIQKGPGGRYGHAPNSQIYCFDEDPPRPLGRIPFMYRNNSLSRFLINMRVFEYPWHYTDDVMQYIPTQLVVLEEDPRPNHLELKSRSESQNILVQWPRQNVKIPITNSPHWTVKPCKVFDRVHNIITNEASLLEHPTHIAQALKAAESSDTFVMCTGPLWPLMSGHESEYISNLTPDKAFAENVTTGQKTIKEFDIYFVMADSFCYETSLLVFCLMLPEEPKWERRFEFTFFGLTQFGKGELLLDQLMDMMDRELISTLNDSTA